MMKKIVISLLSLMPLLSTAQVNATIAVAQGEVAAAQSQQLLVGFFSMDSVMNAAPERAAIESGLAAQKAEYEAEMARSSDDFNARYEDFLDHQQGYDEPILRKRQSELQTMMQKNVEFKKNAQQLLRKSREDALAPLRQKVLRAVRVVAEQKGLIFVLNTDHDAAPYVNPELGQDITGDILREMK